MRAAENGVVMKLTFHAESHHYASHTPSLPQSSLQGSAKRRSPGWVNFVAAVTYHFCLALPAAFTQPGTQLLAEPCMSARCCGENAASFAFVRAPNNELEIVNTENFLR